MANRKRTKSESEGMRLPSLAISAVNAKLRASSPRKGLKIKAAGESFYHDWRIFSYGNLQSMQNPQHRMRVSDRVSTWSTEEHQRRFGIFIMSSSPTGRLGRRRRSFLPGALVWFPALILSKIAFILNFLICPCFFGFARIHLAFPVSQSSFFVQKPLSNS